MPTRKQRRRSQKERRHEYETVWVDAEGNDLEEAPEEVASAPEKRTNGTKPKAKAQQQRGGRGRPERIPPPPSWRRSIRRSLIWVGVLVALLLWLQSRAQNPSYGSAIVMAVMYALLFPVLMYYMDRTMYRRYQARLQQGDKRQQTKKR